MVTAYIALGSNLGEPQQQLQLALQALHILPDTAVVSTSSVYRNRAIGPGEQPDFLNAVVELTTTLSAQELLRRLQAIEDQQGRLRSQRWGARTLDLDILLYGDAVVADPALTIPHPRMLERDFVVRPLLDVAPGLVMPDGKSLAEVAAGLDLQSLLLVAKGILP